MKATIMAAAALLGGASAHNHHQRHAHDAFHLKSRQNDTDLVCMEVVKTVTGDFFWVPTPNAVPANPDSTTTTTSTTYSTTHVPVTETETTSKSATSSADAVPTPVANTCATPGTYTFPASTVTVPATTSAVVPSTTACSPGTYTLGGVTTIVETATTVVCPYATVSTASGGVVTSVIESTTYVCPSAGTYTIAPTTTTVTTSETVTVPSITTILPGTYTAPAVTTEVVTSTVVYCPFASVGATTSSAASAASVAKVASTSSSSSSSSTSETVTTSTAPIVASSAVPVVASSSVPVSASSASVATPSSTGSSSSSSSGTLGGNGKTPWSLTYTPYNPTSGECQTADAVAADVAAIAAAGFTSLRVYSTDCDTLPNVGAAASTYGLKMIVGIYIGEAGCNNASPDVEEQISAFQAWARWDLVELFSVANEALNNGYCTAQELADLISHVKSALPDYTGPYTTTDVVSAWQQDDVASLICDAVDYPSANVHSYFTSTVSPADAGEFVKGQLEIVEAVCGGKTGYILESGYPTAGSTIGLNIPSVANQAIAIASILDTIGDRVVLFSMFDDKWKAAGEYGCEQSWGIAPDLFGTVGEAWATLVAALG